MDKESKTNVDLGEVSDGYHTFNQLYHQRAILFATIVNQNKNISWKSWKHEDRKYCFDSNGEWFIVGIDTPEGSYTYHYSKEYWDYFKCEELECGKKWDGHTEEDVTRLLSLEYYDWIPVSEKLPDIHNYTKAYLVTLDDGTVCIDMFTETNGKSWWNCENVVAWIPLPEGYKKDIKYYLS